MANADIVNMLRYHSEGLERVSRVIDGNANYDQLMEHRIGESQWAVFEHDVDIAQKRGEAIALFEKEFRRRKPKAIVPEFPSFACEGTTRNNLKEFEFFQRVTGIEILSSNYSYCEGLSVAKLSEAQLKARDAIFAEVSSFYHARSEIKASLVRQQVLYTRSFYNYLIAFSRLGAVRPVALVQANDHSPVRVALSMVMKGLGIPRIYLQHAEVTQSFPVLDFEYSVLRNERSRKTYESIGPATGEVYVLARADDEFAHEKLFKSRSSGVTVVIYPTSRVLADQVVRMVLELRENSAVGQILVKQHPAAAQAIDDCVGQTGVLLVKDIPEEDHVAIVGNSSIVIELLHRGIPVYQNFEFDPVTADYYGFVARGLTYSITFSELSTSFWRPYRPTQQWLAEYAEWDPTAKAGYLDERSRFIAAMAELKKIKREPAAFRSRIPAGPRLRARAKAGFKRAIIRAINSSPWISEFIANRGLSATDRFARFLLVNTQNGARFFQLYTSLKVKAPSWQGNGISGVSELPAQATVDLLEYTLTNVNRPADWLQLNDKTQAFAPLTIISALEQLFKNRSPILNVVFEGFDSFPVNSAVSAWVYLKRADWGNLEVAEQELDRIAAFISAYEDDLRVRSILESLLLTLIVRHGTCEQLDRFWVHARTSKEDLSTNRKIDVLRKLSNTPGREEEVKILRRELEYQATPFDALKLKNADFLEGRQVEGWSHLAVEKLFQSAAPGPIAREFSTHILPSYKRLRPHMALIDIRASEELSKTFLRRVQEALQKKLPFSLIRLSDGEGYLFPEGDIFTEADRANRERHWWGTELPRDLRGRIVAEARQAIACADVVGIPTIYRILRDTGDISISILRSVQGRGVAEVLKNVPDLLSPDALVTEDKINVALFADIEPVVQLANWAEKIIIVTSAKRENLPEELMRMPNLEILPIPTHHKTSSNPKYHSGSEALPFIYDTLRKKLEELVSPGHLVLVAGGVVGKVFIGQARAKGGVVLDIGHVLDDWISKQTPTLR